ncbi:MAG: hypothetical protein IKK40_10285 [Bacteroidales bacterium]|nr:hypothetical protein [Bacteroidales bacterium]
MARNSLNHDKEKATVLLSVKRNNRWCEALAPRLKIENKIKSALVAQG